MRFVGNFESRKYSKGNQCDVTPRLPNKTEGLTKNGWHEFYWTWISMAGCPSQKRTCGGLGIEAERMDFEIGIGLKVVGISYAKGKRWEMDRYL